MKEPTDVQRNVAYCLEHFEETAHQNDKTADALKVNRSTVKRWRALQSEPHDSNLNDLSELLGIPFDWFKLPHAQFVQRIATLDSARNIFSGFLNIERKVVLSCLLKWQHQWQECFDKHVGSYFMYNRLLIDPLQAAISLLRIKEITANGIAFEIYNFDTRVPPGSDPVEYRYRGLLFPVAECLSFYGEEQNGTEPFSMVTSSAQVRAKSILAGYFTAVAVAGAIRMPTGTKVALIFRSSKMLEPESELGRSGIRPWASISKQIQELL